MTREETEGREKDIHHFNMLFNVFVFNMLVFYMESFFFCMEKQSIPLLHLQCKYNPEIGLLPDS